MNLTNGGGDGRRSVNVVTSVTGNNNQIIINSGTVTVNQNGGPVIVTAGWAEGDRSGEFNGRTNSDAVSTDSRGLVNVASDGGPGLVSLETAGAGSGGPVDVGAGSTRKGGLVTAGTGSTSGAFVGIGTGSTSGGGLVNVGASSTSDTELFNVGAGSTGNSGLVTVGSGRAGGVLVGVGTGSTSGSGLVNVGTGSTGAGLVNVGSDTSLSAKASGTPVQLCALCASALNGGVGAD